MAAASDGHPVIIFRSIGTDGAAGPPVRGHGESLGDAATDWGQRLQHLAHGDADAWLSKLPAHTAEMLVPFGQSATSIFWSLRGLHARAGQATLGAAAPGHGDRHAMQRLQQPQQRGLDAPPVQWRASSFFMALSAADGRVSGGGRSKTLVTLAACGVRLRSFPMTLDKVIAGLDAAV